MKGFRNLTIHKVTDFLCIREKAHTHQGRFVRAQATPQCRFVPSLRPACFSAQLLQCCRIMVPKLSLLGCYATLDAGYRPASMSLSGCPSNRSSDTLLESSIRTGFVGASGGGVPVTSTGPWHIPIACALPLETGEIPIERITQRITRRQACVGPSDSST